MTIHSTPTELWLSGIALLRFYWVLLNMDLLWICGLRGTNATCCVHFCRCILVELVLGKPLFPCKNELDMIELICKICGTPTEENWPGVSQLPLTPMMKLGNYSRCLRDCFKYSKLTWDAIAFDLVDKLLVLDPSKRLSASDALDHDYFWTDPMPCEPSEHVVWCDTLTLFRLPKYPELHLQRIRRHQLPPRTNKRSRDPTHEHAWSIFFANAFCQAIPATSHQANTICDW